MRQLKITQSITNRESQSLEKYLHEIGKVDLITAEEEVILAQKIREGDQAALERLTKTNLRFVVSVAKQYQNQGLSLPDLINEGNLGLIKAAQRFDETRGFKFISYAVWWIRQSILQALAEQSRIVRLPLNKIGSINKINTAFSKLEQEYEREPSAEEIAELLELTENDVKESMKNSGRHISMDAPLVQGEESNMYDVLRSSDSPSPESGLINDSLRKEIDRALLDFGMPMGPMELIDEVGLDVGDQVSHILFDAYGPRMKGCVLNSKVIATWRLGKKNGKGFYLYDERGKKKELNPEIYKIMGVTPKSPSREQIADWIPRMMLPMINEAALCLDEGIVATAEEVDLGMIMGTGFPPFRGGLLRYADSLGIGKIHQELERLAKSVSPRYKPSPAIVERAKKNQAFYS
jgi:RNA polymerase primary sigma factor